MIVKNHKPEVSPQQFYLCNDYRKLNSLLPSVISAIGAKEGIFALMPLSKTDELFALLKEANFFTAANLHSGYYHIKLDEESIPQKCFHNIFWQV